MYFYCKLMSLSNICIRSLSSLFITHGPWQISVLELLNRAFATLQTIQSTTSHGVILLSCNRTLPQYLPSNWKKKEKISPSLLHTPFQQAPYVFELQHLMVRYPWWSGYEKTQWRRDLREKSSHTSSYTARYPTSTLWCCVYFRSIL